MDPQRSLDMAFVITPEPSTGMLLMIGMTMLFWMQKRRDWFR